MKILAVSDQVVDRLYSSSVTQAYPDLDAIIGCGDLPYPYLEYLTTVLNVPMYYVPGNHDPAYRPSQNGGQAEGGLNLDQRVVYCQGLLMAGLGGSILYPPGGPNQYTQTDMFRRVYQLMPWIYINRLIHKRGLDILVTHSPLAGIHDDDDPTHQGLRALNFLVDWARPRYVLHGHTIFYHQNLTSHVTTYGETQIMNIYPFRVFEIT